MQPTAERDPVAAARHRGPSLVVIASVYALFVIAGIAVPMYLAGGAHFPSPFQPDALRWFIAHPAAALASAFLFFSSAVPLAIFTATAVSRLRFLGMPVAGIDIALVGGLAASIHLATSACAQWVLAQPGVAEGSAIGRALHLFSFATGGVGFAVPFGLLLAGLSVTAGLQRFIPRWLMAAGLTLAAIAELSVLSLILLPAAVFLPVARFAGMLWLIAAGAFLPKSRGARFRGEA